MEQFKKKKLPLFIAGAGGKKSSKSSSRTPVEADDTVNSRAMAAILDLLGEGVIGGLVNGARSIFIDDLPIVNEDGSSNFSGITWDFRDGSQDQTPMSGFDFVETPKSVNIQLKKTHYVTVSIDNDEADRVRVIMKFPSLRSIDKKTGDTNGTTVEYKFQIANGDSTFVDVVAEGEKSVGIKLTAKKTGVYYRSYELKLPKPGRAYKVRVVRIEGDLANAKEIEAMKSTVDSSLATIEEMKKTVAEVERSSAEVTTNIEALAKTNIDLALRQDEDQHKQMVSNAKITTTQKAFADDISAMATKMEEIRAEINEDIRASITEETTARVDADNAIASRITKLESKINDDISAAIVSEQEARASADEALSKEILSLQAKIEGDISAAISEEKIARATADESLAQQITTLKSQTGKDIKAAVAEETKARTDADSALASSITNLQAQTSKDINAAITSEATVRTNADNALSGRIDTLKASVDGNTATIQEQATAIADTNKKVSTAWTLKMETSTSGGQKYVAGIALGIDTTGLSQFLVQADRFGLVNSVNGKITTPFVIENSIAYMNGAYIKNGTIDNTKIGNYIQSNNFVSGSTGWRIDKAGNAEFHNATFRGVIYGTDGYFNGTVKANKILGDIVKAVGKAFPHDPRGSEYKPWPSGTITVVIDDDQQFDRQVMIPAIAFRGAKHRQASTNSEYYSSCRLIVKKNGSVIYDKSTTDVTAIYTGIMDMPAGGGALKLEFSVSASNGNYYPSATISDLLVIVTKKATARISIS